MKYFFFFLICFSFFSAGSVFAECPDSPVPPATSCEPPNPAAAPREAVKAEPLPSQAEQVAKAAKEVAEKVTKEAKDARTQADNMKRDQKPETAETTRIAEQKAVELEKKAKETQTAASNAQALVDIEKARKQPPYSQESIKENSGVKQEQMITANKAFLDKLALEERQIKGEANLNDQIKNEQQFLSEAKAKVNLYSANESLTSHMAERKAAGASEKELNRYQKEIDLNTAMIACPVDCTDTKQKQAIAAAQYDLTNAKSNLAIEQQQYIAREGKVKLCDWGICIGNKQSNESIESIAEKIIRFLARTIASLAVLSFMVGGVLMMVRIDDDGRAQGKKIMTSSVIAVIVVFSAYVIVTFVQQVLYSLGK